ncbi:MAG: helix-turn-helix domain-containing protein [Candidatus Doudnabacteria bacterium]|nr:helix-turn-helix domain-containing protein [Candidatus Doudnabacteria bacterium]
MEITELIAENIVNKLSTLLKKKITVADTEGEVLASTELSETGKNYEQFKKVIYAKKELEIEGQATKTTLGTGLIVPVNYNNEVIGALFIEDKPEEYSHYRQIIGTTIELLIQQNLVVDSFPYKDKIKDNFMFGLLHRRLAVEDSKIREEAELFDVNLNRDKIVFIINVVGFWQKLFGENVTASEDEKQMALSNYKKKIYQAASQFFGRLSGCAVSYFGSDTFVALVDELYSMDGKEMVAQIRSKSQEFYNLMSQQFEGIPYERILIGVGSFYRGKDGSILAYEEARRALNLGISMGDIRSMYHIDDLGMIATLAGGNKKWQDNFVRRLLMKLLAEEYLLETLEIFFDKNMSLTQTAKELKIHRNTLLYRLDKIRKVTGLDPRKFNDAMELKVALILNKVLYLEKNRVGQV